MGITFYSTAQSMNAVFNLSQSMLSTSISAERLSSGYRINRASDDPAGLVISENLRSSIGSMNAEINNLSANISKYSTTSATVQTLRSSLTELRSLAIGAANGAFNSEEAQTAYATAANSIVATFNSIVGSSEYNGSKTLDGSESSLANISALTGIDLSTVEGAEAAIAAIDSAAENIDSALVDIGSKQRYDLEARVAGLQVTRQNRIAAESQIRDTNFFEEYASMVGSQIRSQLQVALMAQSKVMNQTILKLFGD